MAEEVPSWDNISDESTSVIRSCLPGLRPVVGTLETFDHVISFVEVNREHSVGVARIVEGDPEAGERFGVYGLQELRLALELAEAHGAEAVHLVEGPREFAGYPRLVLLCEDPDGNVSRQCVLVAPREDVQREVV